MDYIPCSSFLSFNFVLQFFFKCRIWLMFFPQSYSFRRGTYPSTIFSLSFGPSKQLPDILAASSSSGSIHLFTLGFASHPRWWELQFKIFSPSFPSVRLLYCCTQLKWICHVSLGCVGSLKVKPAWFKFKANINYCVWLSHQIVLNGRCGCPINYCVINVYKCNLCCSWF